LLVEKKNVNILNINSLKKLDQELSVLAVGTRMRKYRIKRDRAEVIGYAADIFIDAADAMQINEMIVPSISISDGIINKMFLKYVQKNQQNGKQSIA
jgi:exopolyphosphatase/guanosine-5'-triphosphate,3'-diphosphate pyrophosphatase